MASTRITQRWPDGIEVQVEVQVEPTFPDAINQSRVEALGLWRDMFAGEDAES